MATYVRTARCLCILEVVSDGIGAARSLLEVVLRESEET
jgi:hypothetical protein